MMAQEPRRRAAGAIAAILWLTACAWTAGARAEEMPVEDIVQSLLPKDADDLTRTLGAPGDGPRGIDVKGVLPQDVALPSVNMTINFEFDSDRLTNDGVLSLDRLAQALSDQRLQGMHFQIAGHTDARGTTVYNQDLSERRAMAVVRHLTGRYPIDANQLIPIGYGETRLLDGGDPEAAINRRVEIINVSPLM